MIYIGIDPGRKGGYAIIDDTGARCYPWDDELFVKNMRVTSERLDDQCIAAVEKVGARPLQGTVSMFNFGKSAGFIEGVLTALGIPYQLVPPNVWKKSFSLIGKDKQASIDTCKRLFPGINLLPNDRCRKDSDGEAESVLLAEWARRNL